VPRLTRVADIFPANAFDNGGAFRAPVSAAAAQLGLTIIRIPGRNAVEIEPAISAFAAEPDGGLLVTGATPLTSVEAIGRLALYHHLPMMFGGGPGFRTEGTVMAHSPDPRDLIRRASSYVDRILRGAKPSELPVQYPTKFELVVNLKTAKAIGVKDVRLLKTLVREKTKTSVVARKLERTEGATRQKASVLGVKLVGALERKRKP
jgi:putative tryptophan/tyrosine transport system substrate-binding protein